MTQPQPDLHLGQFGKDIHPPIEKERQVADPDPQFLTKQVSPCMDQAASSHIRSDCIYVLPENDLVNNSAIDPEGELVSCISLQNKNT